MWPAVAGPALAAALAQDTGSSAVDHLTFNPSITGTLSDPNGLVTFVAGFGATPSFNILSDVVGRVADTEHENLLAAPARAADERLGVHHFALEGVETRNVRPVALNSLVRSTRSITCATSIQLSGTATTSRQPP